MSATLEIEQRSLGHRSERAIGDWIGSRGVRPTLTTKTFNPMSEGADHGLAAERIGRQFESSLERLGVDHVEPYLAQDYDPATTRHPRHRHAPGVRRAPAVV